MQMTRNLPMYEELVPGSPGLGHLPRKMTPQDSTDGGIAERIKQAVRQGMISQQAGQYLMQNMMQSGQESANALRSMPRPQVMPPLDNVTPYGMMRGLLGE